MHSSQNPNFTGQSIFLTGIYFLILSDASSTIGKLVDGDSMPSLQLPLPQLSLLDRYWQFRLSAYRHAFITSQLVEVRKKHSLTLTKQMAIDIHPIFGAYIMYIRALEARSQGDIQECLDQLGLAMDWLESWRLQSSPTDLSQMVTAQESWTNRRCMLRWEA